MDTTQLSSQNKSSRISGHLLDIYQEYKELPSRSENGLSSSSDIMQIDSSGENIAVRITAHDVENLLPSLEEMGFKVIGLESELHFLEGWMPIERIPELESLDEQGLMGVLPIAPPRTKTGLVTSQADFVLEANRVRASLPEGFDGTGVTIGVLSDSYDVSGNGSAAEDIASGDLPANGVDVLEEIPSELTEFADDTFFLGKNDRAVGGSGNDQFYVQSGGGNTIAGNQGNDQFWIVNGELPQTANTITDFEIGEDVIGILGAESLGISSDSLELNQVNDSTEISFGDRTLAILSNQEASLLDTNDNSQFIFA